MTYVVIPADTAFTSNLVAYGPYDEEKAHDVAAALNDDPEFIDFAVAPLTLLGEDERA